MTIKFDETGVPIEANGKKIMKSYQNAYRKAMSTSYFRKFRDGEGLIVRGNMLTPLESSIYKWVMDWQMRYESAINRGIFPIKEVTETPVTAFDGMRYLFSALNRSLYMDILD